MTDNNNTDGRYPQGRLYSPNSRRSSELRYRAALSQASCPRKGLCLFVLRPHLGGGRDSGRVLSFTGVLSSLVVPFQRGLSKVLSQFSFLEVTPMDENLLSPSVYGTKEGT